MYTFFIKTKVTFGLKYPNYIFLLLLYENYFREHGGQLCDLLMKF